MRKRVYRELNEYEEIMSLINDRDELLRELKILDKKDYKLSTTVASIGTFMGTIMEGFGAFKMASTYIDTNDLHYGALCVLIGGITLSGFAINDLIKVREDKYIDKEKIRIVSRQFRPENYHRKNKKTK